MHDRVQNYINKTKSKHKRETLKKAKLRWVGYITVGENDNRWPKDSMTGNEGQERGGGATKNVDDGTNVDTAWMRLAQNRCRWHLPEEVYMHTRLCVEWSAIQGKETRQRFFKNL